MLVYALMLGVKLQRFKFVQLVVSVSVVVHVIQLSFLLNTVSEELVLRSPVAIETILSSSGR